MVQKSPTTNVQDYTWLFYKFIEKWWANALLLQSLLRSWSNVLFCFVIWTQNYFCILFCVLQNRIEHYHVCCVLSSLKLDLKNSSTRDHNFRETQWTKSSFAYICHHIFVYKMLFWAENFTPVLASVHKAFLRIGIR